MPSSDFATFNTANFDQRVLQRSGLTLVDFWSESCIPCRQLSRILEQLAGEIPDNILIGKVNSEQNPELLVRFGVRGVPALLFFKNGDLVESRTGVDRRQVLKRAVEMHAA
jgi:thioredoxin 1